MQENSNLEQDPPGLETGHFVSPEIADLNAVFDEYEFIRVIGKGGMGTVYEARQKSINRPVAIKILQKVVDDEKLHFAERFEREVHVMAQMSHANIVTVYSFGQTTDGQMFFVMEYVHGNDLYRIIQLGGVEAPWIYKWMGQICDALFYAHSMGVVHRDIKPGNILITEKGDVKIADFGLAKLTGGGITDEHTRLTMTNMAMGSPDYVAPEVLETGSTVDHRVDIYAMGVVLYEMLTGKVPRGAFKPPSTLVPGINKGFDEIILKAMDPDQDLRFKDAGELRASIMDIRDEVVVAKFASPPQAKMVTDSATPRKMAVASGASLQKSAKLTPTGSSISRNKTAIRKKAAKKSNHSGVFIGILSITAVLLLFLIMQNRKRETPVYVVPGESKAVALEEMVTPGDSKHRKAAIWILSKGGSLNARVLGQGVKAVSSEVELPKGGFRVIGFLIRNQSISNEDLVVFEEITTLTSISFIRVDISDVGLAFLSQSPLMNTIILIESEVTGSGLDNFEDPAITYNFNVGNSPFSDVGMKNLARSFYLSSVDLESTKITDIGLAYLANKTSIRRLDISGTAVTSAGLDQLRGMENLTMLEVRDCPNISEASRLAFIKAHPDCQLVPPLANASETQK